MPGVPAQIGPYRVTRPLGQGGMGAVYLALDTRLDREVALKLCSGPEATSAVAREQVLAEARAAAAFNHAHIASVHDVLDVDGQVAIVFEYVEGETLADRLKRGRLTPDQAVDIGLQLTDALAAAHQHGIVHRDLKPANVAVTSDGIVKVLDFGVARVMPPEGDPDAALTTFAGFVGTLGYAPPEQALGQSVDARADVFALGVVLFEMLTARRPFPGRDAVTVVQAMLSGEAPRVRSLAPEVVPELDGLIARMLARDPTRRPSSAQQVRDTLLSLAPTARGTASAVTVRRHRWGAALLVVAAITAALVGTTLWKRPAAPADRPPVVAVLPLTNASGDASKDYLAIGFADSLITRLATLPAVTVLSRTAVSERQRSETRIPELAHELGVTYFVDGSVQQAAAGLRITLSLIERDGAVAWADVMEGPLDRIFALQTQAASALGQALEVRISAADRASLARQPTSSAEALDAYWRGRALLDRRDVGGNVDAALTALNQAVALDPRFADAHAARGEALWAKYAETGIASVAQQAIVANTDALRYGPTRAEVRYSLALTLAGTGRLAEAADELRHALLLRPNYDDARRELGEVLTRQGRMAEAISEFQEAIDVRPSYWGHYNGLGRTLLQAARYDEAAHAFRRVVELQPDSFIGHAQLGVTQQYLGNYDEALMHYDRALALGADERIHSNIAAIHHQRGEFAEAVAAYRAALRLRPAVHVIHRNLGDSLSRMGNRKEAQISYERAAALARDALRVNPKDVDSMSPLAVYLAKLGRCSEALSVSREAREIAPDSLRVMFRDAVVDTLCGLPDPAMETLRRAIERGLNRQEVASDEDLASLRQHPEFNALLQTTQ